MKSRECVTLVTIAVAVSALGNSVPSFFIFQRVHYKEHFVIGVPVGPDGDELDEGRKFRYVIDRPDPISENIPLNNDVQSNTVSQILPHPTSRISDNVSLNNDKHSNTVSSL
ncbi:hypothetical protein RN001_002167 [Aquatica leii]|uniref:Uncharacterized protein n=1 Tax=Aquatica leii TaxID=1421715 RepID=A0AAN7PM25_9COLE|nr:hypothetical protein RN001_002167 [Aquatica leii]